MIAVHPRDYQRMRNLGTLLIELGDRPFDVLFDSFAKAVAGVMAWQMERR